MKRVLKKTRELNFGSDRIVQGFVRYFHPPPGISPILREAYDSSKKRKGKRKGIDFGSDDNEAANKQGESNAVYQLPNLETLESKMNSRLSWLNQEFKSLRGGRVTADMFHSLMVHAYGSRTSLSNISQTAFKAPNKIQLSVYDPTLVQDVAAAVRDIGEGTINPVVQGLNITVTVPKPSKEQRDRTVKMAGKLSERVKQDIRTQRKKALNDLKRMEKNIPKDDFYKFSKEIDAVTEKVIKKVTTAMKEKEITILTQV